MAMGAAGVGFIVYGCVVAVFEEEPTVYGDAPNDLPLEEKETRWEYAREEDWGGIREDFTIDQSKHSVFGYKGKQVRDNIHAYDVARFNERFIAEPRCGEVRRVDSWFLGVTGAQGETCAYNGRAVGGLKEWIALRQFRTGNDSLEVLFAGEAQYAVDLEALGPSIHKP